MDTLKKLEKNGIHMSYEDVVKICERYRIAELSLFGSVIRDDFKENSDVDFIVVWENSSMNNDRWDFITIIDDFTRLLNREVDVIDVDELTNPIRRKSILSTCEMIYAVQ